MYVCVRSIGGFEGIYGMIDYPSADPKEKVIKTLIYGGKSSGNQAERGLHETAAIMRGKYPDVCNVVKYDIYVDDCVWKK